MKQTLVGILFFSLTFACFSQKRPPELQNKLDSLWQVWEDTSKADTLRLQAIKSFAWDGYIFSQPDSAYYFAQLEYDFASKTNNKIFIANALNIQGASFYIQGNFTDAIDYYTQSLKIEEEIGNKKGIASALNNIGNIYNQQSDFPKAIDYYTQSLNTYKDIGDKKGMATSFNNIGIINIDEGDYVKAINNHTQSLKIREEIGDKQGIATSLNNIGLIYELQGYYTEAINYNLKSLKVQEEIGDKQGMARSLNGIGVAYGFQGDHALRNGNKTLWADKHAKAIDYYTRSFKILEELGDKYGIALSLFNIGSHYEDLNEIDKAINYYTQSLEIREAIGDQQGVASSLNSIGNVYIYQGDYTKALEYNQDALAKALEIGSAIVTQEASKSLWEINKKLGKSKASLEMHELYVTTRDSLLSEENQREVLRQEYKYEYEKKEAVAQAEQEKKDAIAAQKLKQQKILRNGFIGGFAVVLCFAGVFFTQRNRIGKEKQRSESLLLNILPAEVAEELKEKGEAEARDYDMVSIIFTDFKGFTEKSEKLSASALVKEINNCFKAFDHICEKYDIEKIKTIGDAYMAAGGLPVPEDVSVKHTVLAALEMQDFIVKQHQEKEAKGEHAFEMRVGIHTGPVVAGIVGVKKFQYDIWGDTVNTASRMESSGAVGKVNISATTYNFIKDDPEFSFEFRGKVNAKGKGEIDMYFVS